MLQAIISGTASVGASTWSRNAPATAEKANPTRPDTTAPANMPELTMNQEWESNGPTMLLLRDSCRPIAVGAVDAIFPDRPASRMRSEAGWLPRSPPSLAGAAPPFLGCDDKDRACGDVRPRTPMPSRMSAPTNRPEVF